ncbi:type II toxin-antitoxin system HicA family toxin [Corynebacterium phoceense]|uniref:type II toxin-antitoxin system HicA family toxin n=1 Tax=Corynebacterium phoceense TaxID=1686286 RepID=UPI00211D0A3D|nr:type II toxin-antitoxin system HicA family toxin [Corynebacterium phoceense]MCQ9335027.1 type II toxin-antitoxin system HicA family toxin [Corynebacterium phoceense]
MRATEVNKRLQKAGAEMIRQRGSHQRWRIVRNGTPYFTTVPMHLGDIPQGTLRSIEQQMEPALGKGWLQ